MRYTMSADKALQILQDVVAQRLRWGRQTAPPYTVSQIMEALELVSNAGWLGKPKYTEADVVLLRRQLGAAKSRLTKHLGKGADLTISGNESESDDGHAAQ